MYRYLYYIITPGICEGLLSFEFMKNITMGFIYGKICPIASIADLTAVRKTCLMNDTPGDAGF
jgi:hypothetical protein